MSLYYSLERLEDDSFGVAYAPESLSFDDLKDGSCRSTWQPITFELREGGYADYQTNDLDWPLCSPKLKEVIDSQATEHDSFEWLDVKIKAADGEQQDYYVLHFTERPAVLDAERTDFAEGGFPVVPVFSLRAIGPRRLFTYRDGWFTIIISAAVKDAIIAARCAGVDFEEVNCSP